MKRIPIFLLLLALCIPPAHAAEQTPSFSDVPAGSWFEYGVKTCAEKGIMVGTGEGTFSPDTALTDAECLTLAVRLYDLQHGGDGVLEKAPEDWGTITMTIEGQEPITGGSGRFVYAPYKFGTSTADNLNMRVALPVAEEDRDWAAAQSGKAAVLTAGGASLAGTVDHSYIPASGSALFFLPEAGGEVDAEMIAKEYCQIVCPGPDQWWRDAVYTAQQLGVTIFSGFAALLERDLSGGGGACRDEFARALADAAGDLPRLYTVESLPDLERAGNEGVWNLYEAGVLTGMDEYGRFGADSWLTRAQAAVMVARVLDEGQRVQTPPKAGGAYAKAVAELRNSFGYHNERLFEADDCTVVVNDYGGMMHAHTGVMRLVYKAGSIPGEGTVIELPYPRRKLLMVCTPADTMELSEDGKTFTYSYFLDDELTYEGEVLRSPGVYGYTVDLATGKVAERVDPINYETAFAALQNAYGYRPENVKDGGEGSATALLRSKPCEYKGCGDIRDFELYLIYKPGSGLGDGTVKRLLLPSTVYLKDYNYAPTDRAPDSLKLSEGGKTLTYVYRFDEGLSYGDMVFHDAGTYIYTVDLGTGELSVELVDPYEYALKEVFAADQFQLDRQLETKHCSIVLGTFRVAGIPRGCVTLVYKEGSPLGAGAKRFLPTQCGGSSTYSSILPDTVEVSQDGTVLTYTYHFDEDGYATDKTYREVLIHKAGTYTYTVDLLTGTTALDIRPN